MVRSILQEERECFFCRSRLSLECHHVYFGTANRRVSDKHGLVVWLCNEHHTGGDVSVHRCRVMDFVLRRVCQYVFECGHSHEEFMRLIGRNYI